VAEEPNVKDLENRKSIAQAAAAVFALLAGGSFAGSLPSVVSAIAGFLALVCLIAAWRSSVELRDAGLELTQRDDERHLAFEERERQIASAELAACLLVPVARVSTVDPTPVGVDRAAQTILEGGAVPKYVSRSIDGTLRIEITKALDGEDPWIVAVVGASKVGKSRSLFEALRSCDLKEQLALVAPRDGRSLQMLLKSPDGLDGIGLDRAARS